MGLDVDKKVYLKNKHGFALRISIAVHDCLSVESVCTSIAFTIIQSVRSKIKCRDSGIGEENVLFSALLSKPYWWLFTVGRACLLLQNDYDL